MRDPLPAIHINSKNPLDFLEKIGEIARHSRNFLMERVTLDRAHAVNLRYLGVSAHKSLGAQFICFDVALNRVAVEMRADDWYPDDFPTYDIYVSSAKLLTNPLLAKYNKNEKTRYRLSIETKEKLEPNLPPLSLKYFEHFTKCANKTMLHPLDWGRFYEFVRNDRTNSSEIDMRYLLIKEGFSFEKAEHIADIYRHLCKFKRKRTAYEVIQKFHLDRKK